MQFQGIRYIGPRGPTVMLLALSMTASPLEVVSLANELMMDAFGQVFVPSGVALAEPNSADIGKV